MPRKASKTDQVLDLISGKEETQKKASKRKNVKVIEDSKDSPAQDDLSKLIQDNLQKEAASSKAKPETAKAKSKKNASSKQQESFNYVNVMEEVVKGSINKAVSQFDMCTCERCMADVMALSLTNLPAKYVVTNQQVSPLLNYYSNKYNDIVNIELIKSCTLIKQYPHHDRK